MKPTFESIALGDKLRDRADHASGAQWKLRLLGILSPSTEALINVELGNYEQWKESACLYVFGKLPIQVQEILKAQENYLRAMSTFPSIILAKSDTNQQTMEFSFRNNRLGVQLSVQYQVPSDTLYIDTFRNSVTREVKYTHESMSSPEQIACVDALLAAFKTTKELKAEFEARKVPIQN